MRSIWFRLPAIALLAIAMIPQKSEMKPVAISPPQKPVAISPLTEVTNIPLDFRYATENNFLKKKVYPVAKCLLRPSAAEALKKVQEDLKAEGLSLLLFDCYRPLSVQKEMWAIMPDSNYVANPSVGSNHNRGCSVDLALAKNGTALTMPTDFDSFEQAAHLDYAGGSAESRQDRDRLQAVMIRRGFTGMATEWWHFDCPDRQSYDVLDIPFD